MTFATQSTPRTSLLLLALLVGCKPGTPAHEPTEAAQPAPQSTPTNTQPSAPVGSETISGNISVTGKPPAKIRIDTSMDPACSLSGGDVYTEQYVVDNGKLANVFVYVKSGPRAAMDASRAASKPVVLDQQACRYTPHVIGVVQGGTVEFHNSDPTMHNIHTMPTVVGNETIDVSQGPRGAPQTKSFAKPELMMPVRCNNHPWMNAFINVSATPFFAVSDRKGHFDLHGLPPGDYILGAVHEKLGEQTLPITIKTGRPAEANFTFAAK